LRRRPGLITERTCHDSDCRRADRLPPPHGWADLLARHDLDITAPNLAEELARELTAIRRDLLFRALASPNILRGTAHEVLGAFPTLAELDLVENYVFGTWQRSSSPYGVGSASIGECPTSIASRRRREPGKSDASRKAARLNGASVRMMHASSSSDFTLHYKSNDVLRVGVAAESNTGESVVSLALHFAYL
jgi:hypothetical protein